MLSWFSSIGTICEYAGFNFNVINIALKTILDFVLYMPKSGTFNAAVRTCAHVKCV